LQAAVLRLPLVVRRHADAGLPANVLDRHSSVGLLEDRDDLGLGETGLLHGTSWLGEHARKFYLWGVCRSGKLTRCPSSGSSASIVAWNTGPSPLLERVAAVEWAWINAFIACSIATSSRVNAATVRATSLRTAGGASDACCFCAWIRITT